MGINRFSDSDYSFLPASTIASLIASVTVAVNSRLTGTVAPTEESYAIEGRTVAMTSLEDLVAFLACLYRAQAIQATSPSGLGVALGRLGDAQSRPFRRGGFA